jgi:YggT family protein
MTIYLVAALYVYEALLLVRIFSSWFMPYPRGDFMIFLYQITDPYLNLFRKALPFLAAGGIDFSPIAGFMVIQFVIQFLGGR